MYLFIDVLMISDLISKIVVQVIVIILNYIFSKLIVFKD
jgi:putative flippase GtrA